MRTLRVKTLRVPLLLFFLAWGSLHAQEVLQEVVVNPGDTMWSIANKYLKDPQKWPEIVKYNQQITSDPTIALPGTKIKIPLLLIKEEFRNAELVAMVKEVRFKRKNEPDWKEARVNMILKYEDSLRTLKGAEARVKFPSKEVVQINENSFVVLKPEKILQEIQLMEGGLRASRAKVIMPGGTVVKPQTANSDYQARVRPDKTEVVFVYKGEVNVTAQGKTVKVREGFGTQVPKSAAPLPPMPLTSFRDFDPGQMTAPATILPQFEAKKGVVKIEPPAIKTEKVVDTGKSRSVISNKILVSYTLQLAKDEKFQTIVFEKKEPMGTQFDISKENVPDGTYFMRVSFTDALGMTGPTSRPNTIIKDTAAPVISNLTPADGQQFRGGDTTCNIGGTVKGAALLAVNGEVVFISPAGGFEKFIHLKEGANLVTIQARDVQGNETVVERKIYYQK